MLKELLKPEIKELVQNHNWADLRDVLSAWPPPEIADLLLDIEKYNRVLMFRALPREISSEVFSLLDYEERDLLLKDLTDQETKEVLADLSPDDRTDLLEELPAKATRRMLNLLSPEDLKEARELLGYPEDSVGRQMTPDFVAVRPDWTVSRAINHIRKFGKDSETVNRIYVTDDEGKLLDDILLRFIILADENETINSLADYNVVSLSAFEDQENAVRTMDKYDISALPVVDSDGKLVGIVTFDDILEISEEETTEDFQKISAINPIDQAYLYASPWKLWRKRVPWLIGLLLANFITAEVLNHYEYVTKQYVMLGIWIPLIIGTAGNTGTQSATLLIRSLSIGDVSISDWFKVFKKELLIGTLLAVSISPFTFVRGYFESTDAFDILSVVSLALILLILWSNLIGALLPILLAKMKVDPAVISSPLITTIADVSGVYIYYNIAIMFLM